MNIHKTIRTGPEEPAGGVGAFLGNVFAVVLTLAVLIVVVWLAGAAIGFGIEAFRSGLDAGRSLADAIQ